MCWSLVSIQDKILKISMSWGWGGAEHTLERAKVQVVRRPGCR